MLGREPSDRLPDEPPPEQRPGAPVFERHLIRLSVAELTEERARCSDCGRTPLIGEEVHVYVRGQIVCDLCRALRKAAPVATERMRHAEFGSTVRLHHVA
jgi:hypothetical protein